MSQISGQQTYGDACECFIFVADIDQKRANPEIKIYERDEKAINGERKEIIGDGEKGRNGENGKVLGYFVKSTGRMNGKSCVCGQTGLEGERGNDAKGLIRGQKTIRP